MKSIVFQCRFTPVGVSDLIYMGNTRSDIYQYINMVAQLWTNFAKTG